MDITLIKELAAVMASSSLSKLEYSKDGEHIVLERATASAVSTVAASVNNEDVPDAQELIIASDGTAVCSPIVGIIYLAKEPGAPAFVSVGDKVKKGDVLCLIEAMKMFSEIKAPCDGTISEIYADDGDLAEFNAPLFSIKKS